MSTSKATIPMATAPAEVEEEAKSCCAPVEKEENCCAPKPEVKSCCETDGDAVSVHATSQTSDFWKDSVAWVRAAKNTFTCLIGCSIGDFSMLTYLQYYHPDTSIMLRMVLAMAAGLATSIMLETAIMMFKNGFDLWNAFVVAVGMSFMSMLAMELTMNIVDYILTGYSVSVTTFWFWGGMALSMLAGYLVPLPYNYYKLKKYGKACH